MNILLLDGLPEEYDGIPLSADFRNMIQVDLILRDPELSPAQKTIAALNQLYPEIPADIDKAVDGLWWFYARGNPPKNEAVEKNEKKSRTTKRPFDFEQDANIIFAAFYATYGISLSTVDFLHWWEFMALFEGLPETTLMQRIIYWRTADLAELSKAEKKRVLQMRKLFALKEPEKEPLDIRELEQRAKDQVSRRFEEAKRWAEERDIR